MHEMARRKSAPVGNTIVYTNFAADAAKRPGFGMRFRTRMVGVFAYFISQYTLSIYACKLFICITAAHFIIIMLTRKFTIRQSRWWNTVANETFSNQINLSKSIKNYFCSTIHEVLR